MQKLAKLSLIIVLPYFLICLCSCEGGGKNQESEKPASDTTVPIIIITSPTSNSIYNNGLASTISISGNATDNVAVTNITWVNAAGGNGIGSCMNCGTDSVTWTISDIVLIPGSNVISVTVHDSSSNTSSDNITITYTPSSNTHPNTPKIVMVEANDSTLATGNTIIFKDDLADFSAYSDTNLYALSIDNTIGHGGSLSSAMFHWTTGHVDPGSFMLCFGRNPWTSTLRTAEDFTDVYVRVYVMFDSSSQNLIKVSRTSIFADSNWSQAAVAHLWGEAGSTHLEIEPITSVSGSTVMASGWNDVTHFTWLGPVQGSTNYYSSSYVNRWTCIEYHAKLNTPGSSDGVEEVWIDGILDAQKTGLNFRGNYTSYGWNSVNFESYLNGGADGTKNKWMDHIVISTGPIGLARTPVNPIIYKTTFSDPDSGDTQSELNVQVSTSTDTSGLVWDGTYSSSDNTIVVNPTNGTFLGSRAGYTSLANNSKYYVRVRQSDGTNYSSWSDWYPLLTVI